MKDLNRIAMSIAGPNASDQQVTALEQSLRRAGLETISPPLRAFVIGVAVLGGPGGAHRFLDEVTARGVEMETYFEALVLAWHKNLATSVAH